MVDKYKCEYIAKSWVQVHLHEYKYNYDLWIHLTISETWS